MDSTDLQNNLRSVEANYDATKLQVDNAKTTLESNQILYDEGIISKSDYDKLKLAYDTAQANLTSIQIQKENLEKNIADCSVTAPISGVISAATWKSAVLPARASLHTPFWMFLP